MLRVVLDTNVIVSGTIQNRGNPFRILEAWQQGRFLLVTSDALLEEVRRVLSYPRIQKYGITPQQIRRVVQTLKKYGVSTEGKLQVSAVPEDPQDNQVLSAAIEGVADYIVSGDEHLRNLKQYQTISIVTPREFVDILKKVRN